MQIIIQARDALTQADQKALDELEDAAYPPDANSESDGSDGIEWSSPQWQVLIYDNQQQLVSHVGMLTHTVKCDGDEAYIGGIGGVLTHPDHRGKGYAATAMQHAGLFLRDSLKVDYSLLVCRDELLPYYGKFGWQKFEGDLLVNQSSGQMKFTFNNTMLLAGTKPIPHCQTIDLCGKPW